MPAIPYAPDISPPYEMTPEELAEWLRKLASQGQNAGMGGGAFGGQAMSPAGTSYEDYGVAPPQEPVVDPRLVQKFMQFQQQTQPSLSGSYTRNLENPEANPASFNAPTTGEELNFQRPPTVYDLPSDVAMREQFKMVDESRSKMFKEETAAQALLEQAKADRIRAEAASKTADVYAQNPALLAKNPMVGAEMLSEPDRRGAVMVPSGGGGGEAAIPTVPTGQEDQNINIPEGGGGGGGMPNFTSMAANAAVRPLREIAPNQRPTQVGDFVRQGGQILVWDGKTYKPYRG